MTETPQWDHSKPYHSIEGTVDKKNDFFVDHYLRLKTSPDGSFHVIVETFGRLNQSSDKGPIDGGEDRDWSQVVYYALFGDAHEADHQEIADKVVAAFKDLKMDQPRKMTVIETPLDYMSFDPEVFHDLLKNMSVWGDHRGEGHEVAGWEVDDMFVFEIATMPTSHYA